jgi:hypothetical protein
MRSDVDAGGYPAAVSKLDLDQAGSGKPSQWRRAGPAVLLAAVLITTGATTLAMRAASEPTPAAAPAPPPTSPTVDLSPPPGDGFACVERATHPHCAPLHREPPTTRQVRQRGDLHSPR